MVFWQRVLFALHRVLCIVHRLIRLPMHVNMMTIVVIMPMLLANHSSWNIDKGVHPGPKIEQKLASAHVVLQRWPHASAARTLSNSMEVVHTLTGP